MRVEILNTRRSMARSWNLCCCPHLLFRMLSSMSQASCLLCSGQGGLDCKLSCGVYPLLRGVLRRASMDAQQWPFCHSFNGFLSVEINIVETGCFAVPRPPASRLAILLRNNKALDAYCAASQVTWAASPSPPVRCPSL